MKGLRFFIIILLLLFCAYLLWLNSTRHLFYRRIVLETPIKFEKGFSLNRKFTVGPEAKYWVAVKYQKDFRISLLAPTPPTEFSAEFEISSGGNIVAHGGSDSVPDWQREWIIGKNYVICYLAPFNAQAGATYELSLLITGASPGLADSRPNVIIFVDPLFDEGYPIRTAFIVCVGMGLLAVFAVYIIRSRRQPQLISLEQVD